MTEAEWFMCEDPEEMQDFLRGKVSERRWRLFVCACCRRVWDCVIDLRSRRAVEMSEMYADGDVSEAALTASRREGYTAWFEVSTANRDSPLDEAAAGAFMTANTELLPKLGVVWHFVRAANDRDAEKRGQSGVLRDIFGNPFRLVAFSPEWRTDTAASLASQMYEAREFSAMPILADSLQDAGCDSDDILNHCRDTNVTHVRGCWVVDLVLGKE